MKGITITYPISALFALCYWLLWFTPLSYKLFGPDGSGFIVTGFFVLGIMAFQIILWSAAGVREKTYKIIGKQLSKISIIIVISFFLWGTYMLISLFLYGV